MRVLNLATEVSWITPNEKCAIFGVKVAHMTPVVASVFSRWNWFLLTQDENSRLIFFQIFE